VRDAAENTVAQKDSPPGAGTLPTGSWQPGDTVVDEYEVPAPANSPAGEYRVVVGMYRRADLQRAELRVGAHRADGDELEIARVRLP